MAFKQQIGRIARRLLAGQRDIPAQSSQTRAENIASTVVHRSPSSSKPLVSRLTIAEPSPSRRWIEPSLYDSLERDAEAGFSIPAIQAFRPVTFERHGYPTRISSSRELLRYVDHNFEPEVPGLYRPGASFPPIGYVNSFTHDESELLNAIRDRVAAYTEHQLGRRIRPVTNLLVQMGPYRVIEQLAECVGVPSLSIFEVGPGAGYLGALLASTGHRYASYDVTQSLYLWQSFLFDAIAGNEFVEAAAHESGPAPLNEARVLHLPWWAYAGYLTGCPLRADIVYSNSNLGEMSVLSLKHMLHISRAMLDGSKLGLLMYFSTGMLAQSTQESLDAEFAQFGYQKILHCPFQGFALQNSTGVDAVRQAFTGGIKHFDVSGRGGSLDANTVMALKRNEAPLDTTLAAWNYGWQPPYSD